MRRLTLVGILTVLVSLLVAASAQAFVVSAGGNTYGVAYTPGTSQAGPWSGLCSDPWISSDLTLGNNGLCYQGGNVEHSNEPFVLTWDLPTPNRRYWETTRNYLQQFLRDVADGSGTLTSPYAVTTQYRDAGGRAGNSSAYGGGCVDLGAAGGFTCDFGGGTGHDFPANNCAPTGTQQNYLYPDGSIAPFNNDRCVTDGQLRAEVNAMAPVFQGHLQPDHTPTVVLLTPPGVEVCLDNTATLCSANGGTSRQFCSYHSTVNGVPYVVQPWTAFSSCDEPDTPKLPNPPPVDVLAKNVGIRLASPLSQAHIASIVNPNLDGWYANNGSEINDNGCYRDVTDLNNCVPFSTADPNQFWFGCRLLGQKLDQVTVGNSAQNPYLLQREFNNAAAMESDPNVFGCAPFVILNPAFVVPTGGRPGDLVAFDGSGTASTLIVPRNNYKWDFGDGSTATGPSVVHSYSSGGNYNVTLTVVDRGGNTRALSQTISVLGKNGKPVGPGGSVGGWRARIQLMPQGLAKLLQRGVAVRVSSNRRAAGTATLIIPRSAARRAHIRTGRKRFVVIGRGTVSNIRGVRLLHIKIPQRMAKKLSRLHHLNLTVRLSLVAAGHEHLTLVAAGHY